MIASVAGEIEGGALTSHRPFRSPHHSASMAALTGGGIRARPGEISHHGVLFLDELPEFDPRMLDSLRQPLENGEVAVSRANHRVTYPARFIWSRRRIPAAAAMPSSPAIPAAARRLSAAPATTRCAFQAR